MRVGVVLGVVCGCVCACVSVCFAAEEAGGRSYRRTGALLLGWDAINGMVLNVVSNPNHLLCLPSQILPFKAAEFSGW